MDWIENSIFGEARMSWFRDFSFQDWEIFAGNLLMVVTIAFYMAWWTVSFRPDGDGKAAGAGFFITVALLAGLASVASLFHGINALSQTGKGFALMYILLGAVAFYLVCLVVTKLVFQRAVTSELLLITVWAALEFSALAVLQGSGRFSAGQTLTLAVLVALATGVGLLCYVLHYRLDEVPRFWNGLVPLIVDAGVLLGFLGVLALS
jgi:hypothetical protein